MALLPDRSQGSRGDAYPQRALPITPAGAGCRPLTAAYIVRREGTIVKFIQICASQNDLFALDEEGSIYRYDFNAKAWVELVPSPGDQGRARLDDHQPRAAEQGDRGRWTLGSQT